MFELLCKQPVYFHINFWLFVICALLVFTLCMLPQRVQSYHRGTVYLPVLPLTSNTRFPDRTDQLITLVFVALISLLYAVPQLPTETVEITKSTPKNNSETLISVWVARMIPLLLFSPLVIKYILSHFAIPRLSWKGIYSVFISLGIIYTFCVLINVSGFDKWLINITGTPAEQESVQYIRKNLTEAAILPMAVSAIVIAPLVEEIFFRGFIFSTLNQRISTPAAAILSGLFFGAIHFSLAQTITLSIFGVVQCYLYRRTGSILYPILLHTIFNANAFACIILFANA